MGGSYSYFNKITLNEKDNGLAVQRSSDFWWDQRNVNGSDEKQMDFKGDDEKFAYVVRPEGGIRDVASVFVWTTGIMEFTVTVIGRS